VLWCVTLVAFDEPILYVSNASSTDVALCGYAPGR